MRDDLVDNGQDEESTVPKRLLRVNALLDLVLVATGRLLAGCQQPTQHLKYVAVTDDGEGVVNEE